jgi:hypothetical protein
MNPIDNMSDIELILAVDNQVVDYDYRIEAAKEIYRRAGVTDGIKRD